MAIDTENKRRATMGIWGFMRMLPSPTGAIAEADRRHLWGYRFLTDVGEGIGATLAGSMMMMGLGR